MPGRYRGTRQLPPREKVPWYKQVGRFAARRGYDVLNAMVPGTVFDYREGTGDINPRRAFGNSTVVESARYLRGRPEGMSDEDWARIQREGKEGLFDTAWDLLPIPKIPVVSSAIRRGARNTLLGPNSRSGRSQGRPGATVVPTVSGTGVTTTEKPVTLPGTTGTSKPPSSSARRPSLLAPSNTNALSGRGNGATRGRGVGVADDPSDVFDMLGFSDGFGGVGYRGVTGQLEQYNPMTLERQDIYNTVTGRQMLPEFNNGAYDAEHGATSSNRQRY